MSPSLSKIKEMTIHLFSTQGNKGTKEDIPELVETRSEQSDHNFTINKSRCIMIFNNLKINVNLIMTLKYLDEWLKLVEILVKINKMINIFLN
ncbi:hypothetical protein BpHYR1_030900 [Brachionus plicatilis]|uniref:Uncharacterized protein n=1 Tax=Brachionus plicatilis TaxID=10195 RepID=A0A3M7RNN7_BRAPC|nr:hypothetical protein BpHYR1_030900 [Brachionus plicatilis]